MYSGAPYNAVDLGQRSDKTRRKLLLEVLLTYCIQKSILYMFKILSDPTTLTPIL